MCASSVDHRFCALRGDEHLRPVAEAMAPRGRPWRWGRRELHRPRPSRSRGCRQTPRMALIQNSLLALALAAQVAAARPSGRVAILLPDGAPAPIERARFAAVLETYFAD